MVLRTFKKLKNCFLKWPHHFIFPHSIYTGFSFSISLSTFVTVIFSSCGHSYGYKIILIWISLMTNYLGIFSFPFLPLYFFWWTVLSYIWFVIIFSQGMVCLYCFSFFNSLISTFYNFFLLFALIVIFSSFYGFLRWKLRLLI